MEQKKALNEGRLIPVWVNVALYEDALDFFQGLVSLSFEELVRLGCGVDTLWREQAMQPGPWNECYRRVQRFFEKVRRAGFRIVFILDEFDHARVLFKGRISCFQGLRELSYRQEWRVGFVTTSRRSLRGIEMQSAAISTFDLIFHKHYLSTFNDRDLGEYFERLASAGVSVTPDIRAAIDFYCGGHPYLLEMLGYAVVDIFQATNRVDVEGASDQIAQSLLDHCRRKVKFMEQEGILNKMLQILTGPVINVSKADVEELLRYGFIKESGDGYVAFSGHFDAYVKLISRQVELWPVWSETEITLRNIIESNMRERYGDQWVDKLKGKHKNLRRIVAKWQHNHDNEMKLFGESSGRLIDYSYPRDLFAVVFAEWGIFHAVFGRDKRYWDERARLLSKIRTPLAHNRDTAILHHERLMMEGYCREITSTLGP